MNKTPPEVKIVNVQVRRKIPLIPKTCPVCGKTFVGAKLAKYDSLQCKQKASYLKHAEQRRQKRMEKYHAEKEGMAPGQRTPRASSGQAPQRRRAS